MGFYWSKVKCPSCGTIYDAWFCSVGPMSSSDDVCHKCGVMCEHVKEDWEKKLGW